MKRYRRKNKRIIIAVISAVLIVLIIAAVQLETAVRASAEIQAEQVARHSANSIITETVSEYISANKYTYGDFADITFDSSGHVVSVEALSGNINRVQSELAREINQRLSDNRISAEIAVGSLSGSYLLAGRGNSVKLRICPVGDAEVTLKSSFTSAGNNQTMHRIYAEISANLISSIPLYSFETTENFEFLIAETIIVGDIPDYAVKAWSS